MINIEAIVFAIEKRPQLLVTFNTSKLHLRPPVTRKQPIKRHLNMVSFVVDFICKSVFLENVVNFGHYSENVFQRLKT
ncbi:Replicase polyprotein 1ab [Trichinella spiralis]|uniref:Replicase polyprotein 1ab n=1 Tax=Trichinella spiralis TaxID=6334 RepID=A0ABR3KEP2_TRISP